jgi:hypothetical protein
MVFWNVGADSNDGEDDMAKDMEELYAERFNRYVTAMRNGTPDRIPIRPLAAEFAAKYAGYTCQEVTHDYEKAFDAVLKCTADFDWDAVVPNMVYVWTGLTEAVGLTYYGVPGIDVPPDTGFQYREPPEDGAFMKREEYDDLIADPVRFLYEVWLPRVAAPVSARGEPTSYENNLSFVKGGMAMLSYFNAFGPQIERMRTETGTVPAFAGMLKAPLDIMSDKLRGYIGLTLDLLEMPEKVLEACEALMPHLQYLAISSLDPDRNLPVPIWMHRGCVPFVTPEMFEKIYWPTLKPIVEAIWAEGGQVLFYAEGDWNAHLESFAELPDRSIILHADRGDIFEIHEALGDKFCISGGIPNYLLAVGSEDDVRAYCKKVIDGVAGDGGYIMDASAIMQNAPKVENVRAMTDFTCEYGVYGSSASRSRESSGEDRSGSAAAGTPEQGQKTKPGVCLPWEQKSKELPEISGDAELVKKIWEDVDSLAHTYIWHVLLSF